MMPFENIKVQLIDTPPVTSESMEPWFPEMIKTSDAVVLKQPGWETRELGHKAVSHFLR